MADLNNQKTLIEELIKSISDIRFGSIEITVHDGRITQIERREKVRFDQTSNKIKPTEINSGK